jgi:hypothetical protein
MDNVIMQHVPAHYMMEGLEDSFGLEIELEGEYVQSENIPIMQYWKQVKDGSLRIKQGVVGAQAIEYVFKGPMNLDQTSQALTLLFNYLNKTPKVKVYDSYRTSIHVHVNCMQETFKTVMNFITLSMIFDELFVSQNGQTRIGNNFCLRTRDAEGQLNDLITSVQSYGTPFNVSANNRYSSINVASLAKYGTVEFRSLECSTDYDRVWHWVNTLQSLKKAARSFTNPREIIGTFSNKGPDEFIKNILGPYANKYIAVAGHQQMLHTGMRLAQDFAYCSEWRLPGKDDIKPKKPNQKLNKIVPGLHMPGWALGGVPMGGGGWGAPAQVPAPNAAAHAAAVLAAGDWDAYVAAAAEHHPAQPVELQPAPAQPAGGHLWGNYDDFEAVPEPMYPPEDDDEDEPHEVDDDDF